MPASSPYRNTANTSFLEGSKFSGQLVQTRQSGSLNFGSGFSLNRAQNSSPLPSYPGGMRIRKTGASHPILGNARRIGGKTVGAGFRTAKFGVKFGGKTAVFTGKAVGVGAEYVSPLLAGEDVADGVGNEMELISTKAGKYGVQNGTKLAYRGARGGMNLASRGSKALTRKAASRSAALSAKAGVKGAGAGIKVAALAARAATAVASAISAAVSTIAGVVSVLPAVIVAVVAIIILVTIISILTSIFGTVAGAAVACSVPESETSVSAPPSGSASPSSSPSPASSADDSGRVGCILPPDTLPVNKSFPAEAASVPDPTTARGRITPRMSTLIEKLKSMPEMVGHGEAMGCWRARDPYPDHPSGHACDLMYAYGKFPKGKELSDGNATATWMTQHAEEYGIRYLIWQGRLWLSSTGKWVPYKSNVYKDEQTNPTTGHYDHIHVTVW